MGFESIAELNDFLEGAKEELKNTSDDRPEYVEIKERKEYFKKNLRQIGEMEDSTS